MHGLHKGYSYQDLLTAFLISENLHKKDLKIGVEMKEHKDDSFDDIVLLVDGKKTKFQIKHSADQKPLSESEFTKDKDKSNLSLDMLSKSYLGSEDTTYVVATNRPLTKSNYFKPQTKQESFFLGNKTFTIHPQNSEFLKKFFIETSLPGASFDLSNPGSLEKELLESLRSKVGIGYYPNNQIIERDAAGRLILFANKLRTSAENKLVERSDIFRYLNLNVEYGHIAQDFPFISAEYRLYRDKVVTDIQKLFGKNKFTILQGLPGSGKSHIFDDLFQKLKENQVVIAKHLCYLEPTDSLIQERILVDALYGNLIHQLAIQEPKIAEKIRPYFAATKSNLEEFVKKISISGKSVVLMVDGLDHLIRVVAQNKLSSNLIDKFIAVILEIDLPPGSTLFIASQLSTDLERIIKERSAAVYTLEPWDEGLVEEFVNKHNEKLPTERKLNISSEIIKSLTGKTEGNALYLTYALKEVVSASEKVNFNAFIDQLPKLNSDLNNYYQHLTRDATEVDLSIVQTLALLDFSVSQPELGAMFPPVLKGAIEVTLQKINPLLKPGIVNNGLRIYHESFRRFIIEKTSEGHKEEDLYVHIVEWLDKEGFFQSQRAYRYLIPYLIRTKAKQKVYSLLKEDFIAQSLFYFHSQESILANLNKIADLSAWQQDLEMYCKAVEHRRALHTYSEERYDSVKEGYNEAILSVHGPALFCERLLFDGKPVFPKTYGILLCQMAEHAGGNPPWGFYNVKGVSMPVENDSLLYQYFLVGSAHFLNLIRNLSLADALKELQRMISENKFSDMAKDQIDTLLGEFDYVFGVSKHYSNLLKLKLSKDKKGILHLAIAGYLHSDGHKREAADLSNQVLKESNNFSEILAGLIYGGEINSVKITSNIQKITQEVLSFRSIYSKEKPVIREWYNALQILSRIDRNQVIKTKNLFRFIDGWYRAWLLYVIELSLLEISDSPIDTRSEELEDALTHLNKYSNQFSGEPRAVDLYGITDLSADSFRRTLELGKQYPNYSQILELLSKISSKTTGYLQGDSSGPLTGEVFNSLLREILPVLNEDRKKETEKLIKDNTQDGAGASIYYDSSAVEYLKLATMSAISDISESRQHLLSACLRLGAYGHRKDITLFEIIEPIKFIGAKDLGFAIEAFQKTYRLVEIVLHYTDGRETNWCLTSWLKTMIDTDWKLAIQIIIELTKINPRKDWRVEEGVEYLCEKLLNGEMNPTLLASLYKTLDLTRDTMMEVKIGLKVTQVLISTGEKSKAKKLFDHICFSLYALSMNKHVSNRNNFDEVLFFAHENKLNVDEEIKSHFESKKESSTSTSHAMEKDSVPRMTFSKLSISKTRQMIDKSSLKYFLYPLNAKRFAAHMLNLELNHTSEVRDLILSLVRNSMLADEEINGLIVLKEHFESNDRNDLAAFISMLGFVYARGRNGWYALADGTFNFLANEAMRLSKNIAEVTLATELSYIFSKSSYLAGPTRHFIELLSGINQVDLAKKIWTEAYEVIKYRLPSIPELDDLINKETPSFTYPKDQTLEALIQDLIAARRKISE